MKGETGRYWIRDLKTGRTFCVEPIHNRGDEQHADWDFKHKKPELGAVTEKESIIKKENGFKNIVTLPPGTSPDSYIDMLLRNQNGKDLGSI